MKTWLVKAGLKCPAQIAHRNPTDHLLDTQLHSKLKKKAFPEGEYNKKGRITLDCNVQ